MPASKAVKFAMKRAMKRAMKAKAKAEAKTKAKVESEDEASDDAPKSMKRETNLVKGDMIVRTPPAIKRWLAGKEKWTSGHGQAVRDWSNSFT